MSTPILPVPEKSCETCGTPMTRKRFGARETAKRTGANMRQRSADGKRSSVA